MAFSLAGGRVLASLSSAHEQANSSDRFREATLAPQSRVCTRYSLLLRYYIATQKRMPKFRLGMSAFP